MIREGLRNIAIIAHVDHGKTTLVDVMLKQSGVFRANETVVERVMDSNDLERERGITILAKNTAVTWHDLAINIVDTPGHADFGGEVERTLTMVDGVLLLVDAYEGPMPQTKYVLRKALELHLKPIVVVNKIDRPDQRAVEVVDEVLDLFIELGAHEDQLDFPVVFTSARAGISKLSMDDPDQDLTPLFESIRKYIPAPDVETDKPLQFMVTTLDHDDYVGRVAIGRIVRGVVRNGQAIAIAGKDGIRQSKIGKLYRYQGLKRVETAEASAGDIVAMVGMGDVNIGETICDPLEPEALPMLLLDEPTLSMRFYVNNSPFAGKEGEFVTSRHLRDRLFKEARTNVSLRVDETDSPDCYSVCGRGELHLSILIETMRREGYELQVGKPKVINKMIDGILQEPIEQLTIEVPSDFLGPVMEKIGSRRGEMQDMQEVAGYLRITFLIPARGLIGFRSEFLTDTKGHGIMHHVFHSYAAFKGEIAERSKGSLVAFEDGETCAYGIGNLQDRGTMFVAPGQRIYAGQIIGENTREQDMDVNPCKKKHVTNMRSSASDDTVRLEPPRLFTLEQTLEYINEDELVEVTPKSLRMRKAILDRQQRARSRNRAD